MTAAFHGDKPGHFHNRYVQEHCIADYCGYASAAELVEGRIAMTKLDFKHLGPATKSQAEAYAK